MSGCDIEQRYQRLLAARAWLERRGWRVKTDLESTAPVPRYQITGNPRWFTQRGLIRLARQMGWEESA